MHTRQGELGQDPTTRDGGNHRWRVPVTRQKTSHHTTTRAHQPRGSTRRFAQRTRRTNLHRTRGRLDASSRQPRGSATSSPPLLSTGHHRRHLGSSRSAERHPHGSRDLGVHAGPLDLAYAAARVQRALDDANQLIVRLEAHQHRLDGDIEQATTAAREASLVAKRAQQALAQSIMRLRQELSRPPCLRRARRVSHPSDHDAGTTPSSRALWRAWRLQ